MPTETDIEEFAVIDALTNARADGPRLKVRSAFRKLNSRGDGEHFWRTVRYPGSKKFDFPIAPTLKFGTRGSLDCALPIGTLIAHYWQPIVRGRAGKVRVKLGVLIRDPAERHWNETATGLIVWTAEPPERIALSSAPGPHHRATLQNGKVVEF